MKKKLLSLLLALCMACSALAGLTACSDAQTPTPLSAPTVTLEGNVASWQADPDAEKFEISLDGNLSYVENTVTTRPLTEGQTFKVRAVGDGIRRTTSPWSNSVTYTESASDNEPDSELDSGSDSKPSPEPQPSSGKLAVPTVTVSATGLASWAAVANAVGYAYKINGGAETLTDATSVQLTDGQSITVKALGNGTDFTDSDYSAARIYSAGSPSLTDAPTYLGILASNDEPTEKDGLPDTVITRPMMLSQYESDGARDFAAALEEHFESPENRFGETLPPPSAYDVYARAGATVFIQIWLNNPAQHTILSLKLNGTKYQVGGGLSSFFVEDLGQHYNCIYVAVAIPTDAHTEKSYTVTDIEYIADTYINADGTDEFMNDNDTVTVGLPYPMLPPSISNFIPGELTGSSCTADFTVGDVSAVTLSGSWLGIAVYDGNRIMANEEIVAGANSVSAAGLAEGREYRVIAYLYGDLHDGNGVSVHVLFSYSFSTADTVEEFTVEAGYYSEPAFDGGMGDSGLSIDVHLSLDSPTATYDRLELYCEEELVYTDSEFYGFTTLRDLLADTEYLVRIYYSDDGYSEHSVERRVTTRSLTSPEMPLKEAHPFLNAAVIVFEGFENGYLGVAITKDVKIRLFDPSIEELRAADEILLLCDFPEALTEVQDKYNAAIAADDWGTANIIYHEELWPLEYAKELMDHGDYSDLGNDRAAWQAFFDAASRTYSFGSEDFFLNNQTAYLIARDYFEVFGENCSYEIIASVDYKDGRGFVTEVLEDGSVRGLHPMNSTNHLVSFDIALEGTTVTVTPTARINAEDRKIALVSYEIGIYKNYELVDTLYTSSEVAWDGVDEEAWINAYVSAMKGEAILPSEAEVIERLGWRAVFEIINGIDFTAEKDDLGGTDDGSTSDGVIVVRSRGAREKNIANLAERALLRELLAYGYPESYETTLKTQMLEEFMNHGEFYELTEGLSGEDEMLDALIDGALNSTVIDVLCRCFDHIYHYMSWYGNGSDEILIGLETAIDRYVEENGITPDVNWAESYRRIMMFADFDDFYPFGSFETVTLTVDTDRYEAGTYQIGVAYRYDSYEEGNYETDFAWNELTVYGPLPKPRVELVERRYAELRVDDFGFNEYTTEIEILNAGGGVVFRGRSDDYYCSDYPLSKGYKVRGKTVLRDHIVDSPYTDSEWSDWFIYEGMPLYRPNIFRDQYNTVRWGDSDGNAVGFVYTVNGGDEISVPKDPATELTLSEGDVLRVKAIAAAGSEYTDSEWEEYVYDDWRRALDVPTGLSSKDLIIRWNAVDGAAEYAVKFTVDGETHILDGITGTSIRGTAGATYRICAMPENGSEFKASGWSESIVCIGKQNPDKV